MFVAIFLAIEVAFSKVIDLFCTLEEKVEIYCAKDGRMLYHSTKLGATIETADTIFLESCHFCAQKGNASHRSSIIFCFNMVSRY